jgi:phage-related protein
MAGRSVDLLIRVVTDTKQAAAGMEKAGKSAEGMAGRLKSAALPAAAIGAGVVLFANQAVKSASRTQQAMGAVDSVFGKSAGQVKKWSEQASTSVGLAASEYSELASVMGAQLKNMGVPMDQVAAKTNELITMGADLAATYGGTTAEAVQALGSALRGETDPIERYGISIKQADIAARQAKDGTKALTGEAGKQAKTAALLALATEQAGGAMGQFARETDSAAGSQQIATAQWEDAQSALGSALLPAMSTLAGVLGTVAKLIKQNSTLFMVIVGVVLAFAAAVLVANAAMSIYTLVTTIAASATAMAWIAALWPILLVIAAVMLVVGAVVLLWKKSETFRNVVLGVWSAIKTAAAAVASWLKTAWGVVWRVLQAYMRPYIAAVRLAFQLIAAVARVVAAVVKEVWRVVWWALRAGAIVVRNAVVAGFRAISGPVSAVANAIKRVWESVFGALKRAASGMASALSGPFRIVEGAVNAVVGAVRSLIGWLNRIKVPKISLPKLPGLSSAATVAAPVGAAATRGLAAPTAAAPRAATPAGLTIVIQGAIDPEATARQVRRILSAHDRRMGGGAGLRTGLI